MHSSKHGIFFPSNTGPCWGHGLQKMSKHLPAGGKEGGLSCFVLLAFTALLHLLNCLYCSPQVFSFSPSDPPPCWGRSGEWLGSCTGAGQPPTIKNWIQPFVHIKIPTQKQTDVLYNILYFQGSYWTFCIETSISLFSFETASSRTPKAWLIFWRL